jgi:hypothetical protein
MNYLLTNICLDQKLKVSLKDKFNVIFFNPWGFSKKGVQHQLYETVSFLDIQIESQVFYYIKPLFWGKRAQIGFMMFNFINNLMKRKVPFAVGAFMLTKTNKFWEYGGFAEKYGTSEDFFLSKKYDSKKFKLVKHYFGQDSRRFEKMGYSGMAWYLMKNFWNRNKEDYWNNVDYSKYWK